MPVSARTSGGWRPAPHRGFRRLGGALALGLVALYPACEASSGTPVPLPHTRGPAPLLHVDPSNPRYFTDGSGRPVLLAGSHTWTNFQDGGTGSPPPRFDYAGYLSFLAAHNHNFFRLWTWEQSRWMGSEATDDFWIAPTAYERTGPGTAADGLPRYDLDRLNPVYFDRLRARAQAAGERGIYVSIMLFNGFSVSHARRNNPWNGHPLRAGNNVNGIDGDLNGDGDGAEVHTLAIPAVTAVQEAYVRRVIDAVNDLDNVLYEISNESPHGSRDWQYHIIRLIREYEAAMPKQHPIGMTVEDPGGDNGALFASEASWISPNGDIEAPPPADGRKVILADTDHFCGIDCGDGAWVWKTFLQGANPIFMDPWQFFVPFDDPTSVEIRDQLGYARLYSERVHLAAMQPRGGLASTGFCLANPSGETPEYLVYLPHGGAATVDLTATPGVLQVEWFSPRRHTTTAARGVPGGERREFRAPFRGDAVLYLHR